MEFQFFRLIAAICLAGVIMSAPALATDAECLDGKVLEISGCVDLETVMADDLQLSAAWVRAMQPGQTVAAAYLTILNRGDAADRLLGATTLAAEGVELHEMRMDGDVMSMRPVKGGIEIGPGDAAELKPGRLHFMLTGVTDMLDADDKIDVTLDFEKAGKIVLEFPVRAPATLKAHTH